VAFSPLLFNKFDLIWRNISICICNAQSSASVCDSTRSTYDT